MKTPLSSKQHTTHAFSLYIVVNRQTKEKTMPMVKSTFKLFLSKLNTALTGESVFINDEIVDELFPSDGVFEFTELFLVKRQPSELVDEAVTRLMKDVHL